jgi:hypothetical protein
VTQGDGDREVTLEEEANAQEVEPELEPLSFFGTDFDVHGLVRRLNQGDVIIPNFDPSLGSDSDLAGFQRKFVWKKPQMDRFIDSLLLGFPVPGIFLVQQENRQLLVLDGQQRLATLQRFYSGIYTTDVEYKLENVSDQFKGLTYRTLDDDMRRQLDNTFIHATVVKYNPTQKNEESVYSLFERLNAGGTNLYPHEIRVALYHGPLVELIRDLNTYPAWRAIYGPPADRLKDQEMILRFLAFWVNEANYKRPLKVFLNDFTAEHRALEDPSLSGLAEIFHETCDVAAEFLGRSALRPDAQINAAFADAILVGIASRLSNGPIMEANKLQAARQGLLDNPDFVSAIARATADEDRVTRRLRLAKEAFRSIP